MLAEPSLAQVVVLGAGLTGLSASVELRKLGVPHRVLEREGHPGGHATTIAEAGYRFDRTGHLLHLRDEQLRRDVLEWLGPGGCLELERRSAVYSHGVFTRYPFQANVFGLPPEVAHACVSGFVRAHFDPNPREVKTFEDYCLRHFGVGISEAFMMPYNEKLWGVHPREISASWCDRFVPRPTLDDVLRGAFGAPSAELGYNAQFLYPRLGIGQLVGALSQRAAVVDLGVRVEGIDHKARRLRIADETISFETLISSIPLDSLLALLLEPPDEIRQAASKLRKTELVYLDVALNTPVELPYHWIYVPEPRFAFYRVGAYSSFSSAMAPPNKGSLYVELARREPFDLAASLPSIADQLVEIGVIRAREAIRFARVRRLSHAYVVFDDQREDALRVIQEFLSEHGIESTGRYGRWTYASMEDALLDGRRAAKLAADRFGNPGS